MPGFSLAKSLKSGLQSAVVDTVSSKINSAIPGVNTNLLMSALSPGGLKGGFGDLKNSLGNELLGQVSNKLSGLIAEAPELQGLANHALKIVEKGAADLMGITGEENGLIDSQYREDLERSAFGNFVETTFLPSYSGNKDGNSAIPNPLRDHSSYNYVITLGVLDAASYNNPEIYRSTGFKNHIIQSSGGNLGERYQVFDEVGAGPSEHAEYYIDDISFESIIAPNPNTRVTPGASMTFTVTEPYSMGNFIQAILGSASEAGYDSYTSAPFCVKVDFVGWNLDGKTNANFIQRPMFIPIQIINMDLSVSGQGSVYQVTAVPMAESGLADNVNKIKTPIKSAGLRLHEVLETNDTSVTAGINSHIEALEESGALSKYDRYIIAFPKDRATLVNALKSKKIEESAFTTSPEEREEQRRGATDEELKVSYSPKVITIKSPNDTYAILKTFAENTDLMNAIGLSTLNEDTNAPGNSSEADASQVTNPETELTDTQTAAAQPADKARDFQFSQGEQVTSIIEKLVLQSTYAAERATEGAKNGLNKWFKIDTQVFLDESPITEAQLGRRPKIYVYSVSIYEVPEALHITGDRRASNTQGLINSASKEYNYIYSGKNEDVLNFDLQFNQSFILAANSDFGSASGPARDVDSATTASAAEYGDAAASAAIPSGSGTTADPGGELGLDTKTDLTAGGHSVDVRRKIAEMFHETVTKLPVDLINAEMEIMGDPYFIPQETGNYVARRGPSPTITDDGTMDYLRGPVFANVYFRSPFDYQVTGATMEMPLVVPGFSGLFQIWAVTSNFRGGKFTQMLKMIRMRGQDDESVHLNSGSILPNNDAKTGPETTKSDGTVGGQNPGVDCFPAAQNDDIRKINPAIAADVAAEKTSLLAKLESELTDTASGFADKLAGVDFGIASIPDLTKIIPKISIGSVSGALGDAAFGAVAGKVGGIGGLALGSLAGDAIGGLTTSLTGGYTPTGLQSSLADGQAKTNAATANLANQAKAAAGNVSSAVNSVANTGVAAASNAATAKAKSLLGG